MLKNYLKIAWRNLAKYKFISFINLFGLTVGLGCCLLILTYVLNELSYDRYNTNADRIYRVTRSFNNKDGIVSLHLGAIAPPFGPLLKHDFPEIEQTTRVLPAGTSPIRYKDKVFNEKNVYFVDEHFAEIFDVRTIEGNSRTALLNPYSIMLTEEAAHRYFGNDDPINKTVRLNNQLNCKITGVFRGFPPNSHFHPEIMISFNTLRDSAVYGEKNLLTNYGNNAFYTYLLLPQNSEAKNLDRQFPAFLDRNNAPDRRPFRLQGVKIYPAIHPETNGYPPPFVHLDEELEENGDISRIYIFGSVALFILLIACINYMNLSTARSALRAKEIGDP